MNIRSYLIINYIFAGIILAIFFYSILFSPGDNTYPIKCIHQELMGGPCPSCGLSRGFSAIVRGDVMLARQIQPNSISVFLFFVVQLLLRFSFVVLMKRNILSLKNITSIDVVISTLLFFYFFRNLIFQTLYIFYKMLLTGIVEGP